MLGLWRSVDDGTLLLCCVVGAGVGAVESRCWGRGGVYPSVSAEFDLCYSDQPTEGNGATSGKQHVSILQSEVRAGVKSSSSGVLCLVLYLRAQHTSPFTSYWLP